MSRRDLAAPSDAAPSEAVASPTPGAWLWLFPVVLAVHSVEESCAGEGFHHWIRRPTGREIDGRTLVAFNVAFEAAAIALVRRARRGRAPWVAPALGLIGLTEGLYHPVGCALTRSYSPGTVSGIALWAPLGVAALVGSRRRLSRRTWRRGVGAGLLLTASLVPLALAFSHPSPATEPAR